MRRTTKENTRSAFNNNLEFIPGLRGETERVYMPAGQCHWWGDYFALSVVGAAFVNCPDLIYRVGVTVGDQLVIFSEQALSSSEAAELVAGVEAVAIHGY
jgi:hypothetical protein